MQPTQLNPGDLVYAAAEIRNDGGIPDLAEDALLARPGSRGVIIKIGRLEQDPARRLFLVRFEDQNRVLGPPTGCWADELSVQRPATDAGTAE